MKSFTIQFCRIPFFLFSFLAYATAQTEPVSICYDINMSPYAGGQDLIFGNKALESVSTQVEDFYKDKNFSKIQKLLFRSIDLIAVFLPLNYFESVVQHEVFGHGFRIRDLGRSKAKIISYQFSWPPPYGDANASTYFAINPNQITTTDLACIFQAGIEAQNILAQLTKIKWMQIDCVDPRQSILFLVSQFALNLYGDEKDSFGNLIDGHDLTDYVKAVNLTYPKAKLKVSYLRNLGLINLLDVANFASVYSWSRYLFSGKKTSFPMISIRDYNYNFAFRMGLTPFGPEFFSDHYLIKDQNPIYFYIKAGKEAENTYVGAGFWAGSLKKISKFGISSRLDLWRQPKLYLFSKAYSLASIEDGETLVDKKSKEKNTLGLALSLIISYPEKGPCSVVGEFGWKTQGFLPGYSLYNSPTVRVSVASKF